jgi:exodeoxyribonuclease VII large subunit
MQDPDLLSVTANLPARDVYTVSRLNREIKLLLEGGFPLLWIEGEISNLSRPASGHAYFSLKDGQAQVRCALFRGQLRGVGIPLKEGAHVVVRARVTLYEQRGDFQLIVEQLEDAGEGALRRAFDELKRRLAQEGLFDVALKKPLPRLPRRIGLITSPSGAVLHDILTTLRRRFPAIAVTLYPVPVQGNGAAEKIAQAIYFAGQRRDCDALILARGGGSLEDLLAFNQEVVARAIHLAPIPIVCGVGHETDFTIADMVADARAPTPTAAAEMLSPDCKEWLEQYCRLEQRLKRLVHEQLRARAQHLDWLAGRVLHPRARIDAAGARLQALTLRLRMALQAELRHSRARLDTLSARVRECAPLPRLHRYELRRQHLATCLGAQAQRAVERSAARLRHAAHALDTLSPLATLARGYAIVESADTGSIVRDAAALKPGDPVRARLARGQIDCRVEKIRDA